MVDIDELRLAFGDGKLKDERETFGGWNAFSEPVQLDVVGRKLC
jgi:hypothetical protein